MHDSTTAHQTIDSQAATRPLTHGEMWPSWLARSRSVEVSPAALLFGLCLPILCFALDHWLGLHIYGAWTTPIRVFVGLELAWFAWVAFSAPRSDFGLGATFAALSSGALFALATGVLLFPSAVAGCVVLIGVLGFAPFGALVAFGLAAGSVASATKSRPLPARIAGSATACLVLLVPPLAVRQYEVGVAREALAVLRDRDDEREARAVLSRLPNCDLQCLSLMAFSDGSLASSVETWIERTWYGHVIRFPMRFA